MTLIWVEGFDGDRSLALLWRRYAEAEKRVSDLSQSPEELGPATVARNAALSAYNSVAAEAEVSLLTAADGQQRTHVLGIGVGRYSSPVIPGVSTSIRGAWAFVEWMLCRFRNTDRPLGSVDLLLSPEDDLGDWTPSPEARARLGLDDGGSRSLPVAAATFSNILDAFERWLARAAHQSDNAAFFYFSGHGLWKSGPLLLPEDARLPSTVQSAANIIDIQQTERNMFNTQPSIQCFFIDACQEINQSVLMNLGVAAPLYQPTNSAAIPRRDAWIYLGSYTARLAYGPEDAPPFFTQELLACMERRGADRTLDAQIWNVTTNSLRIALEAASMRRRELEAKDLRFSVAPGTCNFTADLCQIMGPPEVFVKVWCQPKTVMPQASLYVESGGARHIRPTAQPQEWYITVEQGQCLAGADFAHPPMYTVQAADFEPSPPLHPIQLMASSAVAAPGGNT